MGRAYEEDEEATRLTKGKKCFQIWLMQLDT
jgi:hypothetical protein